MPTKTETQPLSLRLEPELIQHLRRIARYESYERDEVPSFRGKGLKSRTKYQASAFFVLFF